MKETLFQIGVKMENRKMSKCELCGEEEAIEYSQRNINQAWMGQHGYFPNNSIWLCQDCKDEEAEYDSKC